LAAIVAAGKEIGNGLHIHLSQSAKEVETVQRLWGKRPPEWLAEVGFYAQPVFAAHLIGVDTANDLPLLAKNKVTFAHCPSSNGAGGSSGSHPYPEALAAGVNTAIGIDTHSNDYIENIKLAVLYGRARARLLGSSSPAQLKAPSVWDAVASATLHPARGLGREDLGRITPGAKADLCTVDVSGFLTGVGTAPPEPLNNLLYANGLCVRHVMTDGHFQVFHGRFIVDNEDYVLKRGGLSLKKSGHSCGKRSGLRKPRFSRTR
jgi:cytosine/adenosine deaminase-related metal-dependent hydrolase